MSTAIDRVIEALERKGCRRSGSEWTCPSHDDSTPSLSVSEGNDGRVLLKCQAGCQTEKVIADLGLDWKDLFLEPQHVIVDTAACSACGAENEFPVELRA